MHLLCQSLLGPANRHALTMCFLVFLFWDSFFYKEWDTPQTVFALRPVIPLWKTFLVKWVSPPSVDPPVSRLS